MNIQNLSDRDILCLQYSILEELKTVKTDKTSKTVDNVLSQTYKNETRSEVISARVTPSSKQSVDESEYSYGDVFEYFVNSVLNGEPIVGEDKPIVTRESSEYSQFRTSVLKRDKVCQCCGSKDDLIVHHLFSFSEYNHLGADTKNGVVLCKECHKRYHSQYGTKKHNNPITFAQFLRDYGMNTQSSLDEHSGSYIPSSKIYENIKNYEEDYGECCIDKLVSDFEDWGADGSFVRSSIRYLIKVGKCYSPKEGYVKVVE